jgi:dipeptidyl aminopeptidase/acylaminoacyl peptidase
LRYPDSFYACVSVSGNKLFSGSERYIGNAKEKKFYFFHGDDDKYIPIEEAYIAEKELKKNGGIVEMFIFKNGGHTLTSDAYYKAITELSNIN